jgi:hypothetical protein
LSGEVVFGGDPDTPESHISGIVVRGRFFGTEDGNRLTIIQSSDFTLFKRYLMGEDITPILQQRADIGFNTLRVWLLNKSVVGAVYAEGLHPNQHADYYSKLTTFVQLAAAYGLYVELTVFTSTSDPDGLMPNRADQQTHLDRTADAVRGLKTVLLELVNESDQYNNAPAEGLERPAGVIISRGSNGADSVPPHHDDPWDYELYHTNNLDQFQRKVGHNAMEWADQSGRPCMSNENTRYADGDSSPVHAYDAAMGAALLCAGSCYHSNQGKRSELYTGDELVCAEAWVAGAKSVPLEFQDGRYVHVQERERGDVIRAYDRVLADGRRHSINIRA